MKKFLFLVALLLSGGLAQATVTLPSYFTDNMVLQQQTTLKLRGKASPNASVSVQTGWSRAALTARADASGNWILEMRTPKAGGPYTLTFDDGTSLMLKNVMIGEVWLGSGQSNMEMPVKGCLNYEEEIKNANYPNIRLSLWNTIWGDGKSVVPLRFPILVLCAISMPFVFGKN